MLLEEKTDDLMSLANKVSLLRSRHDEARKRAQFWEQTIEQIREHSMNTLREIKQVRMVAWILYLKMCEDKGEEPKLHRWDVESHFVYIKATLKGLEGVLKKVQRKTKRGVIVKKKPNTEETDTKKPVDTILDLGQTFTTVTETNDIVSITTASIF